MLNLTGIWWAWVFFHDNQHCTDEKSWRSWRKICLDMYLFPTQKDLIVLNEIVSVMRVDASADSHPISYKEEEILRPDQINELFDSITYSKVNHIICDISRSHTDAITMSLSLCFMKIQWGLYHHNSPTKIFVFHYRVQQSLECSQTLLQKRSFLKDFMWVEITRDKH